MPSDCELAENDFIEKKDILKIPLIFHRRAGLQQLISHWADTDIENFNIAATYNVVKLGFIIFFLNTPYLLAECHTHKSGDHNGQ